MSELLQLTFWATFLSAAVRTAIPILCASIGEDISEKAGIINVGLEAVMLVGAFFGFAAAYLTRSLFWGFVVGMLAGMLLSLLHAFLSVYLKQDQNVAGVALNLLATGLTSYIFQLMVTGMGSQIETLKSVPIPLLSKIPLIGDALFNKDIVVYFSYLLVVFLVFYYKKTIWGMSLCAVGENPRAADAVGISVYKNQYMAAAVNGLLGGLGGAYLLLGQLGIFFENITAGRGYIALTVVVFGRRNPIGILLAALFFGAAEAFQFRLQILGISLPIQVLQGCHMF